MAFEWDPIKAELNRRRHGVDFADAVGVFDDPLALTLPDPHATAERLVTLGRDYLDRLVLVIWTWRGENIRVISAREPTARSDGSIWRDQMRKKYDFTKAKRGAVAPASTGKTRITIRLDNDILVWFREQVHAAGGGNYQTLINQALRRVIEEGEEPLETVMRRIVREEIQRLPRYSRGRSSRGA